MTPEDYRGPLYLLLISCHTVQLPKLIWHLCHLVRVLKFWVATDIG